MKNKYSKILIFIFLKVMFHFYFFCRLQDTFYLRNKLNEIPDTEKRKLCRLRTEVENICRSKQFNILTTTK